MNHPSLRWGAGKTTDFFGSLQIPVNLEGGTLRGAAPRKEWRQDELKSRGKNLFWGSMEPHPDRIHLNYCGILTFSKETEGAPIPQREFGRFCDAPGILGCFSLRCPREAMQDLCSFFFPSTKLFRPEFPFHPRRLAQGQPGFLRTLIFPFVLFPRDFSFPCLSSWRWGTIISCRRPE